MIPALMGLPGKAKTLLDRLTDTRASALDNLNAALSSRAPAATALSNATWTAALATSLAGALKLARAEVVTVSGSSGTGAGRKFVDVTIAAITVGKAMVFLGGAGRVGTGEARGFAAITNATSVRVHYVNPNGSNNSFSFRLVIIAFA